jgi:RHS repeat-associated protein
LNDGTGDDRVFYHCNTQYSTHALTDETGSIVEAYQYDAYGRPTVFTDPGSDGEWFTDDDTQQMEGESDLANKYFFQGRRFDEETQMQYFRNRYYNSRLGRFISRDPMGVWYDMHSFGNGYAPFSSNTKQYRDPVGLLSGRYGGVSYTINDCKALDEMIENRLRDALASLFVAEHLASKMAERGRSWSKTDRATWRTMRQTYGNAPLNRLREAAEALSDLKNSLRDDGIDIYCDFNCNQGTFGYAGNLWDDNIYLCIPCPIGRWGSFRNEIKGTIIHEMAHEHLNVYHPGSKPGARGWMQNKTQRFIRYNRA